MTLATAPAVLPGTLLERGHAAVGLVAFLVITHLIGRAYADARRVPGRVVGWGVALAFAFGGIVLYAPGLLAAVQDVIQNLLDFTVVGAQMVFGNLATYAGAPVVDDAGRTLGTANTGAVFAFIVLPTIVFVSMLTAILYRLHVLGWVVNALAWVMRRTMGTSGAETLSTAANIFVGPDRGPADRAAVPRRRDPQRADGDHGRRFRQHRQRRARGLHRVPERLRAERRRAPRRGVFRLGAGHARGQQADPAGARDAGHGRHAAPRRRADRRQSLRRRPPAAPAKAWRWRSTSGRC